MLEFEPTVELCMEDAGRVLRNFYGRRMSVGIKGHFSQIVTEADLESERAILDRIKFAYPNHNILSEEIGFLDRGSDYTWIIDPLDGSSNFSCGLPWFGVMICVVHNAVPIVACHYVPELDLFYRCTKGNGVFRNGHAITISDETDLKNILCSIGMDAGPPEETRRQTEILFGVAQAVRNVRATNSLIDFCYLIDGRLGGLINFGCRIWDIAGSKLMMDELGGKLTHIDNTDINFNLTADNFDRNYQPVAGSKLVHEKLLGIIRAHSI